MHNLRVHRLLYTRYTINIDALKISTPNSRVIETNALSERPEAVTVDQRYMLKCNWCLWNTSYVDLTGNLNPSGNSIPCPRCRKGLIEVETRMNKKIFLLPAYLDYVLSD